MVERTTLDDPFYRDIECRLLHELHTFLRTQCGQDTERAQALAVKFMRET